MFGNSLLHRQLNGQHRALPTALLSSLHDLGQPFDDHPPP